MSLNVDRYNDVPVIHWEITECFKRISISSGIYSKNNMNWGKIVFTDHVVDSSVCTVILRLLYILE